MFLAWEKIFFSVIGIGSILVLKNFYFFFGASLCWSYFCRLRGSLVVGRSA